MMKKFKISALMLALTMVFTTLSACSNTDKKDPESKTPDSEASTTDSTSATGELVPISWYFPDNLTNYDQKVYDEINRYVGEKIGVKVDFHVSPWGTEYDTKVATMISAGQEFDVMFNGIGYAPTVAIGAAMPVEDILKTNAKETWELLPKSLWDAVTVNEHIYGIPIYKDNAGLPCIIYNKTLAEEIGVKMPETFGDMSEMNDLLYDAKKKKDAKYPADASIPLMTIYSGFNYTIDVFVPGLAATNIAGVECIQNMGSGDRVFNYYETPDFLEDAIMTRKWVEDGILPLDRMNYDRERVQQTAGKILMEGSLGLTSMPENSWSEDFKVGLIRSTFNFLTTESAIKGVHIFGAKSKNPEKAAEFMNLVNTDNYVANTIRFGIEGEFYNRTEDNRLDFKGTLNEDPANRAFYRWYGWQYGSIFSMSIPVGENGDLWNELKEANETANVSENMGFLFNPEPVQTEIAACTAVTTEFAPNLTDGMVPNVEANVKEFRTKLKAAGSEKVVAEAQKQLDVWRAANGKSVYKPQ